MKKISYTKAGVNTFKEEKAMKYLLHWTLKTSAFRKGMGSVRLESGYFATILNFNGIGLAFTTDGVGSKILIAQMMNKYDTVGIDCVAMNVNDLLCVGAEPISMLDYIALEDPKPGLLDEIGKGLYAGAKLSRINIPGGETAQLKDMLKGKRKGYDFDLAGAAIGVVSLDKILIGQDINPGDRVIGLASSGVHSNGLTLARNVLLRQFSLKKYFPELGRKLGEELLEPTRIYVPQIMEMLKKGIKIKALSHITSDGFLNLARVKAKVGYVLDNLPKPHPVFNIIQHAGRVSDEEMFQTFNMGIGFCIVVPGSEVEKAFQVCKKYHTRAYDIGYAVKDPQKKVMIPEKSLAGIGSRFLKQK
ncbi:MAG: phosphoribosylformylglycinamidine cyclo-ligase [Candidatus Omnitrophica bacterium]|nr:phosphoribosylformylglycinamidine cyclo-ligase [Candidatus Omnitrophota bacterium]